MSKTFVPVTPGGTICDWLERSTEDDAWEALMAEARHMPYPNKEAFIQRGYEVCELVKNSDERRS